MSAACAINKAATQASVLWGGGCGALKESQTLGNAPSCFIAKQFLGTMYSFSFKTATERLFSSPKQQACFNACYCQFRSG